MKIGLNLIFALISFLGISQYAPDASSAGTTAIPKNSNLFVNWANGIELQRGYLNIQDKSFEIDGSNKASFGTENEALGLAEGNSANVVSLGDSGVAILTFPHPIKDGAGADFAVFENSFSDDFLELAHVEVSSDGINYMRFPSHSLSDTITQIGGFGNVNPEKINNLAGKYRQGFGTPFDLSDINDSLNILDFDNITHVKIIDAIGTINSNFGTRDSYGNLVNDPFPTPFESGGFDLDAVGVINENNNVSINDISAGNEVVLYPTIFQEEIQINSNFEVDNIEVFDLSGRKISFEYSNQKIKLSPTKSERTLIVSYKLKDRDMVSRVLQVQNY